MQYPSAQDQADLIRAARTDTEAFGLLYDCYVQPLYRYCYHRTNNARDAEDLTSQTFLAALEAFPRLRRDGHFAAWLFTVARNKIADHYRRTASVPLEESAVPPSQSDPADEAETSQRKALLLRSIGVLADDEQELIRLRYVADLPFAEIARALHKTEDATKKMLYRLLARLRSQMEAGHE